MSSRNLLINFIFALFSLIIFYAVGKLLLLCAGLCFTVDQQTQTLATGLFLIAGLLAAGLVIYKNR